MTGECGPSSKKLRVDGFVLLTEEDLSLGIDGRRIT